MGSGRNPGQIRSPPEVPAGSVRDRAPRIPLDASLGFERDAEVGAMIAAANDQAVARLHEIALGHGHAVERRGNRAAAGDLEDERAAGIGGSYGVAQRTGDRTEAPQDDDARAGRPDDGPRRPRADAHDVERVEIG